MQRVMGELRFLLKNKKRKSLWYSGVQKAIRKQCRQNSKRSTWSAPGCTTIRRARGAGFNQCPCQSNGFEGNGLTWSLLESRSSYRLTINHLHAQVLLPKSHALTCEESHDPVHTKWYDCCCFVFFPPCFSFLTFLFLYSWAHNVHRTWGAAPFFFVLKSWSRTKSTSWIIRGDKLV